MMINTTIPASMWGTYLRGLIPGIWSVPSADMEGYIHKVLQVKSSRTLELECLITFEVPDPTSILTVLSTTQPVSTTNICPTRNQPLHPLFLILSLSLPILTSFKLLCCSSHSSLHKDSLCSSYKHVSFILLNG
ncbi:hypothetical protein GmHk_04G011036 [Glycine max]|nr:hypothetical protein GmHk_04G011036 [Glycine max]